MDEPYGALDTKQKKDSVFANFLRGGRTTQYSQHVSLKYILPTKYFSLIDWINITYTYSSSYTYQAANLNAINYGNLVSNDLTNNINAQFNFEKLYGNSKYLKAVLASGKSNKSNAQTEFKAEPEKPPPFPTKSEALEGLKGKERENAFEKWKKDRKKYRKTMQTLRRNAPVNLNFFTEMFGNIITIVRSGSIDYTDKYRTSLPGWVGSLNFIKNNYTGFDKNIDFAFGFQPNTAWLDNRANLGFFTDDPGFNLQITQNYSQKISFKVQLEPAPYFTINVHANKSLTKSYSELFKDTNNSGFFQHLSPISNGGFSVSYYSLNTLFENTNGNNLTTLFKNFQTNRIIVAKRVASQNPYWNALPRNQQYGRDGFPTGYNKYAQEVLIPSFLAAYTNSNPNAVALIKSGGNLTFNPFSGITPLPNWQATYTGIAQIPAIKEIFTSFTIRNGYTGTFEVSSFSSNLLYNDPLHWGGAGFRDTISGNFIPYFLVPNISINESLDPLIAINVATKVITANFSYSRSRTLSLSLIDYQVSQSLSDQFNFGTSYKINDTRLPFRLPAFFGTNFKTSLIARIDVTIKSSKTTNSKLDLENSIVLSGQSELNIFPTLEYLINTNFSFKLFFEQRYITPYVSNNYDNVNTRAGITIRYTFR